MKKIIFALTLVISVLVTFGCKNPCLHVDFTYDSDNTHHWKVCALCGDSFEKKAHDDHDYIKATEVNIKFRCSECENEFLRSINTDLKNTSDSVIETKDTNKLELLGVEPIKNVSYVIFGVYPQTVKDDSVTILTPGKNAGQSPTTVHELAGHHTVYLGSDGEWYFMQQAAFVKPAKFMDNIVSKTYSTGKDVVENEQTYFKMEPVVWRKVTLSDDEGMPQSYLIADKCLEAFPYYRGTKSGSRSDNGTTVLDSNYVNSDLFAFLTSNCVNTLDNYKLYDYINMTANTCTGSLLNKMFFDSDTISNKLELFSVDGKDVRAAAPSFQQIYDAYVKAEHKVRKPTDYAIATGAKVDNNGYCNWWTRSPADVTVAKYVSIVREDGSFYHSTSPNAINNVDNRYNGVVPYIQLKAN